ncbi:acyl-CoA synthetase (AMP-forming)/AMP-acid ligase II [Silvimonas terrae]|uniref:Acyl-CoA synthetase (AMP-forming)/AMP-acid ligase II n=1 Tax=Silvimonas terrae TaxID=300266 RepID=A0A840REK2_9NEIS|nr:AMP-binding protein [Silvimonas terrae]MBB5190948.1 acyl-CoA synthetase (AMP-forming)/AMP-acid ligase II [Silvimonas terrae]
MSLISSQARFVDATQGQSWQGSALAERIATVAQELQTMPPGLILLPVPWTVDTVCRYLAGLSQRRALALLDPDIDPATVAELAARFAPAGLWFPDTALPAPPGYRNTACGWIRQSPAAAVHPDLALLLTTSGSTGAARMVRLGYQGVLANADAIVQALEITAQDIALTSLPFHLGYGLSVLNSHLRAGATVVISAAPVIGAEFWAAFERYGATSFAAVSHTYDLLTRLHWTPASHPTLHTLTQSGSRMRPELVAQLATALPVGGRFLQMYGQTEATARMVVLPAAQWSRKAGAVGLAIPGGRLSIRTETGEETTGAQTVGEVIFRGPSVMLGYADHDTDLARGDDCHGVLHTGDVGRFDEEGYLYLEGRLKRMAKLFGLRINLDAVERLACDAGAEGVAAVSRNDEAIVLWCEGAHADLEHLSRTVAERLRVNHRGVEARTIEKLPLLRNGKIDYRTLTRNADNGVAKS